MSLYSPRCARTVENAKSIFLGGKQKRSEMSRVNGVKASDYFVKTAAPSDMKKCCDVECS